jgi:predicted alpha/beta superfamily hydrolase
MLEEQFRKGQKYIRFVTKTLKPFVDNNFRTKKKRQYGIGAVRWGIDQHI